MEKKPKESLPAEAPDELASPRQRSDNRREVLVDKAAELFCQRGYDATSLRDIAAAIGMQPGSMYYHFASKDDILLAVYTEGVRRLSEKVKEAVVDHQDSDPWTRLEAACCAHLHSMLHGDTYVQVLSYEFPHRRAKATRDLLVPQRDAYERIFRDLIGDLPLKPGVDRKYLRLTLLGAMAWTLMWYHPGPQSPKSIGKRIMKLIRAAAQPA